jgi:hypothetical protein
MTESTAPLIAVELYKAFLEAVNPHIFSPQERARDGMALGEIRRQEIERGRAIDTRVPYLARVSGKGGWSDDPARRARYAVFANVSLLDHLMSVVRGGLMFAALDLGENRSLPPQELRPRLAVIAVVAFLHDADKMLGRTRKQGVGPADMAWLADRYGLDAFLASYGVSLTPTQLWALRAEAEVTTAGRLEAVPREHWHDCTYVRMADRLDGIFLKTTPTTPGELIGVDGVLREIQRYDMLDSEALKRDWRVIELRDPHTPFLLDEFQAALSVACTDRFGMPPLIEIHHDGRLLMVLPRDGSDAMIETALRRATRRLGATIRVATNARGKVDLLDAPGTLDNLRAAVTDMMATEAEKVLRAGIDVLRASGSLIDDLLRPYGLLPHTPDLTTYPGRLVPLWSGTATEREDLRAVHRDAVLINAVLSCDDPSPKLGIPDARRREGELLALLAETAALPALPSWLVGSPSDTRRALLAALAAGAAASNRALSDRLLGADGLLALWLEGRDDRPGLASKIDASGSRLGLAVADHYRALLSGSLVVAQDEAAEGRCHFTNTPVPRSARIDGKTGLYGINVSAFSGREGRPESVRSQQSETLVAPVAEAEHRLRALDYERTGRSPAGRRTPIRITSPTTAGLFGALAYANDADPVEYAFSDILRARIEPGRLNYVDDSALGRRARVARYEEMPTRLITVGTEPGQISFLKMAFEAAQRTGRPIHLFRGQPLPRPEFVAFDALPQPIEQLLNGTGFRLEQLAWCVMRLRGMEAVADATGFGAELALRIADPDSRFGAACDAFARVETRAATDNDRTLPAIRAFATTLLGDSDTMPSDNDRALVAFGEAMARAQRIPLRDDGGNVAELGLRTALDTAEALERIGQVGEDSLIAGIAGEIEATLSRRGLMARREARNGASQADVIAAATTVFVRDVWNGAFDRTVPSSRIRRVALATYRFAFEREARRLRAALGHDPAAEPDLDPAAA